MVPSPGLPHPETHGRLDTPFFRVGLERAGFAENHAENEAPNLNSALSPPSPCPQGSESYQEWSLVERTANSFSLKCK